MGLKPDHWIRRMATEQRMIEPFVESQVRNHVISYGVSSYGYDIRVADEFKVFTNVFGAHGGIFPNPAQGADGMSGKVYLCSLWHYHQRDAI